MSIDPDPQARDDAGALIRLVAVVTARWRTIAAISLLGLALSVTWGAVRPSTFTSSASLIPHVSDAGRSQLSGLAAQLGVSVGASSASDAPEYYPELIRSRGVLRMVLDTVISLPDQRTATRAPLWWWLHPKGADSAQRIESAVDLLAQHVAVNRDKDSGIIRYSVTYPDSLLPGIIAARILTVLNDFNLRTRQSAASAERAFVEGRLEDASAELRLAENNLQAFLQANRDYRNSPQLLFQQDRLQRNVNIRQGVVASLTQAYEQARIDEVRNTPVFMTLEQPQVPVRPDPRRLARNGLLGLLFGFVVGVTFAIGSAFLRNAKMLDPQSFDELWRTHSA